MVAPGFGTAFHSARTRLAIPARDTRLLLADSILRYDPQIQCARTVRYPSSKCREIKNYVFHAARSNFH